MLPVYRTNGHSLLRTRTTILSNHQIGATVHEERATEVVYAERGVFCRTRTLKSLMFKTKQRIMMYANLEAKLCRMLDNLKGMKDFVFLFLDDF